MSVGSRQRPPWFQASHRRDPPDPPRVEPAGGVEQRIGAERQGQIERATYFDAEESRFGNADDFERTAAHGDSAADDTWIAAELAPPERMTHHHAGRAASTHIVLFRQEATQMRSNAKQVEVVAADPEAVFRET